MLSDPAAAKSIVVERELGPAGSFGVAVGGDTYGVFVTWRDVDLGRRGRSVAALPLSPSEAIRAGVCLSRECMPRRESIIDERSDDG